MERLQTLEKLTLQIKVKCQRNRDQTYIGRRRTGWGQVSGDRVAVPIWSKYHDRLTLNIFRFRENEAELRIVEI